jgi:hypothetical protein
MDLYQRQQFDMLLQMATERFVAKLEERHRGIEQALAQLASDTKGGWVAQFVEAVFEDFLLNSVDGACFMLRSLARRPVEPHRGQIAAAGTVEELTLVLAKSLFSELLLRKTVESLEQHIRYQPV